MEALDDLGAFLALFSPSAGAAEIGDIEVAAKIGGGSPSPWVGEDPLVLGLGARAGASWRRKVYLGASFVDYFGEASSVSLGSCSEGVNPCPPARVWYHSILVGVEGGYSFEVLDTVTLRPQIGAGDMVIIADGNAVYNSAYVHDFVVAPATTHHVYLEPGVTFLVPVRPLFVGADVNALWLVRDSTSSVVFTAHAQIGIKF